MQVRKMELHTRVKHGNLRDTTAEGFQQLAGEQSQPFTYQCSTEDYRRFVLDVCFLIAITESPHTIGETLLVPVLESFFKQCLHASFEETKGHIHLLNDSVARRIQQL